ncbi:DUF1707 SHOCT-like domain-containing protein [Rhodococcus gannanensis]|uniref:DUF1707 domain-containing protein n=1 Tax=Rhodococcus gannanensis TaxID=1960308 RepID=A0ABW4P3F0_9NOCA
MNGTGDHDDLLLSDDERLHALNVLGDHYAAGRLDSSEFYERSGDVASARTLGAVREPFLGLPGGVPLDATDGRIRKLTEDALPATWPSAPPATEPASAEAELQSLRSRGSLVENLDWAIVGVTLITFLILQLVVGWDYAWIVWPSLVLTLSLPRMLLKYSDADEKTYEQLKKSDERARRKRLEEAADRIRELEGREQ